MPIRNVIVYSKTLPPEHVGGIETNGFNFIQYLAAQSRFNLVVVTQRSVLPRKAIFWHQDHDTVTYGQASVNTWFQTKKYFKRVPNVLALFAKTGFAPRETVIFHNSLDLHDSYAALRDAGYRQMARSGGNDIFFMQNHPETGASFIRSVKLLDRLFVNSEYSLARSREAGVPAEMMDIVKGGCEIPALSNRSKHVSSEGPLIITCGRLVDFKGIDDALDALAQVQQAGIPFSYWLVGDGQDRAALEAKVRVLGLEKSVRFIGKVQPDRINELYQQAHLYLSTSKDVIRTHNGRQYLHTETMGRSLCEAQASGLPAVTTNAGGSAEMVCDGKSGLVVNQGNVQEIAAALKTLLTDEELRNRMGEFAYQYARESLSWDAVFGRYIAAMDALS